MYREFKEKYFTNNLYFVNKDNYKILQEIALEIGCLCHTGKSEIIEYHDGFNILGFRTYEKNNNVTFFQKEAFLIHNQSSTDFNDMFLSYNNIVTQKQQLSSDISVGVIKEFIKDEIEFCKEIECEKNEHGQFIYISKNGVSTMNLPYILQEYKQWLIDKNIVKNGVN